MADSVIPIGEGIPDDVLIAPPITLGAGLNLPPDLAPRIEVAGSDGKTVEGVKAWLDNVPAVRDPAVHTGFLSLPVGVLFNGRSQVWGYASGDGYAPSSFPVTPGAAAVVFVRLNPEPQDSADRLDVTVTTSDPSQLLSGVDLQLSGADEADAATNLGVASFKDLDPGAYHLVASKPGYHDIAHDFILPDTSTLRLVLVEVDEDESEGEEGQGDDASAAPENDNFDLIAARAQPPEMDSSTFEAIYGNSSFEAYFTGVQARVYIGNLFVDELYSIQYALQSNVVPVYGYASRFPDAWGEGKGLVQGQLALNYVSPAYMFTLLDAYLHQAPPSDGITGGSADAGADARDLAAILASRAKATAAGRSLSLASLESQITALAAGGSEVVRQAKTLLRVQGFDPVYLNAAYLRVPFDITIEIGAGSERTYRRLEGCRLISNEQILDQSGRTLADAYGFLARRLR